MREEAAAEEPNWFSRWEEELPSPEELMPLSQTLITPHLALAFDIPTSNNPTNSIAPSSSPNHQHHHPLLAPPLPSSNDFDSADLGSSGANTSGGGDEPARTLKRPRLVWTPQLHKRFVDAVAHLGIKNAVPKTIMQLMSVDGLTRENVASHLQKYRLYLKRMQGLGGASGGPGSGSGGQISAAEDHLFSSGPIPHHFLTRGGGIGGGGGGGGGGDPYGPYVPMAAIQHHQQQMAVAAAAAAAQQQFYHQRQIGHVAVNGNGGGAGFDHGFLSRGPPPPPHGLHRIVPPVVTPAHTTGSYVDDLEERNDGSAGGRRVLTLFPTGND